MANELFSVEFWLTQTADSTPLLVMLVVGMVICYRQRLRRPRVARLLGWALLAELIWEAVGWPVYLIVFFGQEGSSSIILADPNATWMTRLILLKLPGCTVSAAIWGTVLWAVLVVDDWQGESAGI